MNEKENLPMQSGNTSQMVVSNTGSVNFFDPAQFETAQRMSNLFASSMLVPDTYQTEKICADLMAKKNLAPEQAMATAKMTAVANCMIAFDIATRIGASPLMVMQNLVIIYGRPSWSSKFLISTVNTCGRFEPLKFRFTEKGKLGKFNYTEYHKEWIPGQNGGRGYYKNTPVTREFDGTKIMDIECVAYTTSKGSKDILESSPISLRMAIDEGWYLKNGSKWQTMPRQMLMYRAASFWTSVYAPELSMGMRTVEETQDIHFADAEEIPADTAEEVEKEKAAEANKETFGFSDDSKPTTLTTPTTPTTVVNKDGSVSDSNVKSTTLTTPADSTTVVDRETGEILSQTKDGNVAPPTAEGPGY